MRKQSPNDGQIGVATITPTPTRNGSFTNNARQWLIGARNPRTLALIIVFLALLLDNMLLTTVVPVIPSLLSEGREDEYENVQINITQMHHYDSNANNCSNATFLGNQTFALFNHCASENATERLKADIINYIWGKFIIGLDSLRFIKEALLVPPCLGAENFSDTIKQLGKARRHKILVDETFEIGVMFASKSVVQLFTNPIIGPLTNRIGYTIPLFVGFTILAVSTLIFAFTTNYVVLFFARALQGIGSACSSTAGIGMLASYYPDDAERGRALGIALGGLALGVLLGPSFGGFMYQYVSKEAPFIVLASLAVIAAMLQLIFLSVSVKPETVRGTPLLVLLQDRFILITAGAIWLGNVGLAVLEPTLPIWMLDTMEATKAEQGAAFLPGSVAYLLGTSVFGRLSHMMDRWRAALIGMLMEGVALFAIPFARNFYHLIGPNSLLGFAIGMVDSAMMPTMGHLVDLRYVSIYGTVYAIADIAFELGFAFGPVFSGNLVKTIGFNWLIWIVAMVNVLFAPMLYFLKKPSQIDNDRTRLSASPALAKRLAGLRNTQAAHVGLQRALSPLRHSNMVAPASSGDLLTVPSQSDVSSQNDSRKLNVTFSRQISAQSALSGISRDSSSLVNVV